MYPIRYPFDGNYKTTQKFGENPDVYAQFDLEGHNGIDFGTPTGVELKAVADGTVRYVGYDPEGYGHYIRLDHHIDGCDFQTLYAHSDQEPFFIIGETVKQNDTIMLSDNCGYSTGPHLHFGLREIDQNGNTLNKENGYNGYIDPQPWLDDNEPTSTNTDESDNTTSTNNIPDWAYDSVEWAIENEILDSLESAQEPVSQEAFKYTLIVMLYRYYLYVNNGTKYSGTILTGGWPSWANESVSWGIAEKILDSTASIMEPVSQEAFKYTLIVMLYRYYLYVNNGTKYSGTILTGGWPSWVNESVSWGIDEKILDSTTSVMEPVSQEAFKYTLAVMLNRYFLYI